MPKTDHPAYGEKSTAWPGSFTPHLLPSVFEPGVYYLHQEVRGEHPKTLIRGEEDALKMLAVAREKAGLS